MKQKHLEETYIGLSAAQIDVATRVPTNFSKAPQNVRDALISRRLYTSDGKPTKLGASVFKVFYDILTDRFAPADIILKGPEAEILNDPQKIARQDRVKNLGLRSGHVKVMRALLHKPGISMFTLEKIFGADLFNELISCGLASRHEDSHQIFPTNKGITFMKECIHESVSKSNKGVWRWVCRTCKRKYPENGDGSSEVTNPFSSSVKLCECGGVVDLSPTKKKGVKNG
jgi:hypothetical protein